ncbi:hypothetical protein TGAM01_v205536 [Trichoderma gamsii]|uniref:Uncharacterized protein n=1 Tax=Trichoderma gamsii TaxID=398673 RepID=A0A2P4ZMW4_9HYPO|nr:hypothetical protein TGAM01_v205536 [Trichoderma gamsii]PON25651.1 hypothetical protein TGAM01_v205536 [Trichoderma gamsii]
MDPRIRPDVRTIGGSALRALSAALVSQEAVCQMRSVSRCPAAILEFVCPCSGSTQSIDFRRRTEAGQQPEPSDWRDSQRRGNSRWASETRRLAVTTQTQNRPGPVLCIDKWEGRNCARGFQAIRHGMAWRVARHPEAGADARGTGTWLSRGRGVIERWSQVAHTSCLLEPLAQATIKRRAWRGKCDAEEAGR